MLFDSFNRLTSSNLLEHFFSRHFKTQNNILLDHDEPLPIMPKYHHSDGDLKGCLREKKIQKIMSSLFLIN